MNRSDSPFGLFHDTRDDALENWAKTKARERGSNAYTLPVVAVVMLRCNKTHSRRSIGAQYLVGQHARDALDFIHKEHACGALCFGQTTLFVAGGACLLGGCFKAAAHICFNFLIQPHYLFTASITKVEGIYARSALYKPAAYVQKTTRAQRFSDNKLMLFETTSFNSNTRIVNGSAYCHGMVSL